MEVNTWLIGKNSLGYLQMKRSVKDYVKYEELKSLMNALDPSSPKSCYISNFICRLRKISRQVKDR